MPARQPGPPACDREQRHAEGAELAHAGEEIRVAGEVDRAGAHEDVAESRSAYAERTTAAVVLRMHGVDANRAELDDVAGLHGADAVVAAPANELLGAARDDDERRARQELERAQ